MVFFHSAAICRWYVVFLPLSAMLGVQQGTQHSSRFKEFSGKQGLPRRGSKILNSVKNSSDGTESAWNTGDPGSVAGLGRSPGEGNPLQYSRLENPMDGGAGQLQSRGSRRVGCDWVPGTSQCILSAMRKTGTIYHGSRVKGPLITLWGDSIWYCL